MASKVTGIKLTRPEREWIERRAALLGVPMATVIREGFARLPEYPGRAAGRPGGRREVANEGD